MFTNDKGIKNAEHNTCFDTRIQTIQAACADILAAVGRDCTAKRIKNTAKKDKDLYRGGNRSNRSRTKAIHGGLEDDGANRGNGILNAHRDAHAA